MPFTPFHFGPSACIALPLDKYIDVPAFMLANVIVDIEPLAVMVFKLSYPTHGYFHTFLIGSLLGVLWGAIAYSGKGIFQRIMRLLWLPHAVTLKKTLISAVLGVWFHVLVDSFSHSDVRPFYPFEINPMYGIISNATLCLICAVCFIPALAIYGIKVFSFNKSGWFIFRKN